MMLLHTLLHFYKSVCPSVRHPDCLARVEIRNMQVETEGSTEREKRRNGLIYVHCADTDVT